VVFGRPLFLLPSGVHPRATAQSKHTQNAHLNDNFKNYVLSYSAYRRIIKHTSISGLFVSGLFCKLPPPPRLSFTSLQPLLLSPPLSPFPMLYTVCYKHVHTFFISSYKAPDSFPWQNVSQIISLFSTLFIACHASFIERQRPLVFLAR
jgi:hypothetical protein